MEPMTRLKRLVITLVAAAVVIYLVINLALRL
jgi:hypothetical protein